MYTREIAKIKTNVLEWSDDNGGIIRFVPARRKMYRLEGKAGYQYKKILTKNTLCFVDYGSGRYFLRFSNLQANIFACQMQVYPQTIFVPTPKRLSSIIQQVAASK